MHHINCTSDFSFELLFAHEITGALVPPPQFRWEAMLYTSGQRHNSYRVASRPSGNFNCIPTEEGYKIIVDHHNLKPGHLVIELHAYIADELYGDRVKEIVLTRFTDILLVSRHIPASSPDDDNPKQFRFPLTDELSTYDPIADELSRCNPLTKEDIDTLIEECFPVIP
ncbi:MAG: hypothetical protein NC217_07685 [Muribaculaceae bacterium]|nr:hypothetical protein [Muribaculaceae bacterium]